VDGQVMPLGSAKNGSNVFKEGELDKNSASKDFLLTAQNRKNYKTKINRRYL
jgi:hypothetical protein